MDGFTSFIGIRKNYLRQEWQNGVLLQELFFEYQGSNQKCGDFQHIDVRATCDCIAAKGPYYSK